MAFNKSTFVATLNSNALPPFGQGICAKHVRIALEAAGVNSAGHPVSAKHYGPFLKKVGFAVVTETPYVPQIGDIGVIQGTSKSVHGHIAGYDGTRWVSDFVQKELYPGPSYRAEKPKIEIYRG
jgi:hypothetical protein